MNVQAIKTQLIEETKQNTCFGQKFEGQHFLVRESAPSDARKSLVLASVTARPRLDAQGYAKFSIRYAWKRADGSLATQWYGIGGYSECAPRHATQEEIAARCAELLAEEASLSKSLPSDES